MVSSREATSIPSISLSLSHSLSSFSTHSDDAITLYVAVAGVTITVAALYMVICILSMIGNCMLICVRQDTSSSQWHPPPLPFPSLLPLQSILFPIHSLPWTSHHHILKFPPPFTHCVFNCKASISCPMFCHPLPLTSCPFPFSFFPSTLLSSLCSQKHSISTLYPFPELLPNPWYTPCSHPQ